MTNAVMAAAPGLWGPGVDRAAASGAIDQAQTQASSLIDLATNSPAPVIALGIGLALWLVGDRLFRPAASLIGAIIGALLGLAVANSLEGDTIAGLPAPYAAIGLGSVLGLAIGAAMYRLAVGGAAAVTLAGLAGAVAAAVALHEPPGSPPERPETIAEARASRPRVEEVSFGDSLSIENLQAAATDARSLLRVEWDALPEQARNLVLAASILGCVVGFALGVIKPRTAGPGIAALAGSALWLGATTALLAGMGRATPPLPSEQPGAWLAAWLLVALVGFAVQRRVIRPAALVEKSEAE